MGFKITRAESDKGVSILLSDGYIFNKEKVRENYWDLSFTLQDRWFCVDKPDHGPFRGIGNDLLECVELGFTSHYNYLDNILPLFWTEQFKENYESSPYCGLVRAHGDKAYGYRDFWKAVGIEFNRGVLIYLLTYTKELGCSPKHMSGAWVVENYPHYLPAIIKAEKMLSEELEKSLAKAKASPSLIFEHVNLDTEVDA